MRRKNRHRNNARDEKRERRRGGEGVFFFLDKKKGLTTKKVCNLPLGKLKVNLFYHHGSCHFSFQIF